MAGPLTKAGNNLTGKGELLKVQGRKMEKGTDFFYLFKDRQLGRKLGGEQDIHIAEDQFSV